MKKLRNDIILGVVVLLIAGLFLIINNINKKTENLIAYVYHQDELVYSIDLSSLGDDVRQYTVQGDEGEMIFEAKHNAIRVAKDACKYHICKNQGYVSDSLTPIICVPNKVYVKIVGAKNAYDVVI